MQKVIAPGLDIACKVSTACWPGWSQGGGKSELAPGVRSVLDSVTSCCKTYCSLEAGMTSQDCPPEARALPTERKPPPAALGDPSAGGPVRLSREETPKVTARQRSPGPAALPAATPGGLSPARPRQQRWRPGPRPPPPPPRPRQRGAGPGRSPSAGPPAPGCPGPPPRGIARRGRSEPA